MLHPLVLADLLADEVAVASERLGERVAGLRHDGRHVTCPLRPDGQARRSLTLDGGRYDAEPFRAAVCGPDGLALSADGWPQGLAHSIHPVLGRPFACVRGDMRTRSLWEGGSWAETIWPNRATGDRRFPCRPAWSRARTPDDLAVRDRGGLASVRGVRFGHQRMTTGRSRNARTCRRFDGPRWRHVVQ